MKKSAKISRNLWNLTKLTLSGAIVFAIGFAFGIFDEKIEIKETHADIIDFGDQTETAKFVDAMERLGHDHPRAFDLNGNVVYFSHKKYREDPQQVYENYQDEFFRSGINSKRYGDIDPGDPNLIIAGVVGEIIPLKMTKDYISMGGMLTRNKPGLEKDYNKLLDNGASTGAAAFFRGHRHIEIVRDKKGMGSEAIATFSGEDFDYNKMKKGYSGPGANPDPIFPSCPGCSRITRFSDLNPGAPFTINSYETPRTAEATTKFYIDSMRRRGWQMTEASTMFFRLRKHVGFEGDDATQIQFSKNGEFMTVLMYPNQDGGLDVHGTLTY